MFAQRLQVLCGSVSFVAIAVTTSLGWAQSDKQITPSQVEVMIQAFAESPEGAKLGIKPGTPKYIPPRECSAFVDPHSGRIRWGYSWVDPVNQTVSLGGEILGLFVKKGDEYVIKDAHIVKSIGLDFRASVMILEFLSSDQAAAMPSWVVKSRTSISQNPRLSGGSSSPLIVFGLGDWRVDVYGQTVQLANKDARLTGIFQREDEDYVIKNVEMKEFRKIESDEAKEMLLRFLAKAETEEFNPLITETRKAVEDSDPVDNGFGSISVGPWDVDQVAQWVRLRLWNTVMMQHHWHGMFVKEDDNYAIYLLGESRITGGLPVTF